MLSVEEARSRVEEAVAHQAPAEEIVDLEAALGRVLVQDVAMDHAVPPFRRSAMDGYAVRAADASAGTRLVLEGRKAAGDAPGGRLADGGAWWVNTGAPVPEGTDRVLPVEWTREVEGAVEVVAVKSEDRHVVDAGAHARRGDVVARRGDRIDPGHVSAIATAGHVRVRVAARPRVGVLGTGAELVDVAEQPGPGRIRNSNGPMLRAQARRAGALALDLGVATDETEALAAALDDALARCDLLLLSGGVSKGDRDLVPGALADAGVEEVFHRWAVQPGGPLWFGRRGDVPVFGLPGNPAASFVGFELLVVPALAALEGAGFVPRPTVRARYVGPWGRPLPRRRFRPVGLTSDDDGRLVATARPWTGSGDPRGPARMQALAALPEDRAAPAEGPALVDVVVLGDAFAGTPGARP